MRIVRAEIAAFGHLESVTLDLDHPIVALVGPNEAGKSTLFAFFQSMLYGFSPASRDTYPYVPWKGANASGALVVRLHDGSEFTVTRRLMSTPDGRMVDGVASRALRNEAVPFVDHVDRRVFKAVYALTLQDMAAIESGAWGEVQDKLLGGMNVDHVLPAREVISRLEDDGKSYWRDDRRSRPKWRELQDRLRELKDLKSGAAKRDESIRFEHAEIERKEARIADIREELVGLKAQLRRTERIRPVMQRLAQIRGHEARAGDMSEIDGLPADLDTWVSERKAEIAQDEESVRRLDEDLETLRSKQEAVTDADRLLLEHESALRELIAERGAFRATLSRRQEREVEVASAGDALDREVGSTLSAYDEAVGARLRVLPMAELNQRAHALNRAEQAYRDAAAKVEAAQSARKAPPSLVVRVVVLAVGLTLLVLGFAMDVILLQLLGMAAAAIGGMMAYQANEARRESPVDTTLEARRSTAEADRNAARSEFVDVLDGIPIPEVRLRDPDPQLAGDVDRLRQALDRFDRASEGLQTVEQQISADLERVKSAISAAGLSIDGDLFEILHRAETELQPACARRDDAETAKGRIEYLERDRDRLVQTLDAKRAEFERVQERLLALGDGDVHVGLQTVADRRSAHQFARTLWETLEKEHPDWAECEREAGEVPDVELSDEAVSRAEQQRAVLEQELTELDGDLKKHRNELTHLEKGHSVDQIESDIAWVESEIKEVERRRDRLQLLANLIRHADLRYREQHQPDVLKRARDYLNAFTDGRYTAIATDESDGSLLVLPPGQVSHTPVDTPLSQGTRDQIYLALRLAIADHLDDGRVRLPLFLDETFVNWDERRRRRGIEILREMSAHRQIFVFTCHPWLAEEIQMHAAGNAVDLQSVMV